MKFHANMVASGMLLLAAPVDAAVMKLSFAGTVSTVSNWQAAAPFGAVSPGTAYTASFIIDTEAPALFNIASPTHSRIDGGTGYGLPAGNLAVVGSITINGITFGNLGTYTSNVQYTDEIDDPAYGDQHIVYAIAQTANYQLNLLLGFNTIDFLPSAYLTQEFSYSPPSNSLSDQSYFGTPDGGTLHLTVASVSSQQISTAPEPTSWAMMLAGFGAVGLGLRGTRRSRRIA